jgi:hypothetical protein
MLNTFKETYRSIIDKQYGNVIVAKKLREALWYWTKYLILFTVLPVILFIFLITYFVPQLSKLASSQLPEVTVSLAQGKLSVDPYKPLVFGNADYRVIVDLEGKSTLLDTTPSGLLVLQDRIIFKNSQDDSRTIDYQKMGDFQITKSTVVNWLSQNQLKIYGFLFLAIILIAIVSFTAYWLTSLFTYAAWSAIYFFISKIIKRPMRFMPILLLTIYASVPSLVVSALLFIYPNQFISIFTLEITIGSAM